MFAIIPNLGLPELLCCGGVLIVPIGAGAIVFLIIYLKKKNDKEQ